MNINPPYFRGCVAGHWHVCCQQEAFAAGVRPRRSCIRLHSLLESVSAVWRDRAELWPNVAEMLLDHQHKRCRSAQEPRAPHPGGTKGRGAVPSFKAPPLCTGGRSRSAALASRADAGVTSSLAGSAAGRGRRGIRGGITYSFPSPAALLSELGAGEGIIQKHKAGKGFN